MKSEKERNRKEPGDRGRERKEIRININKRSDCYLTGQNLLCNSEKHVNKTKITCYMVVMQYCKLFPWEVDSESEYGMQES